MSTIKTEFVIWKKSQNGCHECFHLDALPKNKKDYFGAELGTPIKKWSKDLFIEMSKTGLTKTSAKKFARESHFPRGVLPIVSERLFNFLTNKIPSAHVQFLPLKIKGTFERPSPASLYYFMNPLVELDVIDAKASKVEWNPSDETSIFDFKQLVFNKTPIKKDVMLFRAKGLGYNYFLRKTLSEEMKEIAEFYFLGLEKVTSFNIE